MAGIDGIMYTKAAAYIGAAFAIGVGVLGPAIGMAMVASKAMESMGKNPESADHIRKSLLIPLLLIEACAIYCLIIAATLAMS